MSDEIEPAGESNNATKDIPEEKKDKIKHLQEIVGGLEEEECKKVLEENDWNLEQAVHKIMDIPMAQPVNIDHSDAVVAQTDNIHEILNDQLVRRRNNNIRVEPRPFNQRIIRLDTILNVPWYWQAFYVIISPFQKLFQIFWYFISAFRPEIQPVVENPIADVRSFIQYVQELETPAKPPFSESTYGECVAIAKNQLKLLIVYLHKGNDSDSEEFLKKIVCTNEFIRLVSEHDALLWGCSVDNSNSTSNSPFHYRGTEGRRVLNLLMRNQHYSDQRLPLIAVIGLSGMGMSSKLGVLARMEGSNPNLTPSEIIRDLNIAIQSTNGPFLAAKAEQLANQESRNLRQQQDLDYQESLAVDRAREAEREKERSLKRAEDAKIKEEEEREAKELDKWICEKERSKELLPSEPPHTEDNTLLVRVKLPCGKILNRRFYQSDSLKVLYYYILSQDESPRNFMVTSNFPARKWPCQPTHTELYPSTKGSPVIISRHSRKEYQDPPSFEDFEIKVNTAVLVIDLDA